MTATACTPSPACSSSRWSASPSPRGSATQSTWVTRCAICGPFSAAFGRSAVDVPALHLESRGETSIRAAVGTILRAMEHRSPLTDPLVAGAIAAVLSGAPSTLHALLTGRDPLEASLAAGTPLLPPERRPARPVPAPPRGRGPLALRWGGGLAAGPP